jgi:hypothetical protein
VPLRVEGAARTMRGREPPVAVTFSRRRRYWRVPDGLVLAAASGCLRWLLLAWKALVFATCGTPVTS